MPESIERASSGRVAPRPPFTCLPRPLVLESGTPCTATMPKPSTQRAIHWLGVSFLPRIRMEKSAVHKILLWYVI